MAPRPRRRPPLRVLRPVLDWVAGAVLIALAAPAYAALVLLLWLTEAELW